MIDSHLKANVQLTEKDVITVKGTFMHAKGLANYILSKWVIILLAALVGGAIGLYVAYTSRPTYTGTLTFVLSTGSNTSNFSGLASQIGIDLGGQSNTDVFSGDNIVTLFKSKRMIKSALFQKPPDSSTVLANILVRELKWDKKWKKNERTTKAFPFPEDGDKLSPVQDSLVRELHAFLLKERLTIARTDPKLSIYTLSTTSENEVVACYLTRYLMDETADFYISTKTSSAKQTLRVLQRETDSLRGLLGGSITSTAVEADRTFAMNSALQVQKAPAQKSQVRSTILATAYGEMVKHLQLAKIALQKENPLYQVIDVPELPLTIKKTSKKLSLVIGLGLGILLSVFSILFNRIIKSLNA